MAKRDRISEFVSTWRTEHPGEPFIAELESVSDWANELKTTPLRQIRSLLAEFESKKIALETGFPHLARTHLPFSDRHEAWEYSFCEVLIPHLKLEIGRRAPRGNEPVQTARSNSSNSNSAAEQAFRHSPDYRSVTLRGAIYALTPRQAQIVEMLHRAYTNGTPDVSIAHLLEQLGRENSRWQDSFKGNPVARSALIVAGSTKGTLRLKF